MKPLLLLLLLSAVGCMTSSDNRSEESAPKGLAEGTFLLVSKPVAPAQAQASWLFTVETRNVERLRIVTGRGEMFGNTANRDAREPSRRIEMIRISTRLIPGSEGSVAETLIQLTGTRITDRREGLSDTQIDEIISVEAPSRQAWRLNTPVVLGRLHGRNIRLMVGSDVDGWNGEPDGPANRSQPIRAETNRASVTAGSDR